MVFPLNFDQDKPYVSLNNNEAGSHDHQSFPYHPLLFTIYIPIIPKTTIRASLNGFRKNLLCS